MEETKRKEEEEREDLNGERDSESNHTSNIFQEVQQFWQKLQAHAEPNRNSQTESPRVRESGQLYNAEGHPCSAEEARNLQNVFRVRTEGNRTYVDLLNGGDLSNRGTVQINERTDENGRQIFSAGFQAKNGHDSLSGSRIYDPKTGDMEVSLNTPEGAYQAKFSGNKPVSLSFKSENRDLQISFRPDGKHEVLENGEVPPPERMEMLRRIADATVAQMKPNLENGAEAKPAGAAVEELRSLTSTARGGTPTTAREENNGEPDPGRSATTVSDAGARTKPPETDRPNDAPPPNDPRRSTHENTWVRLFRNHGGYDNERNEIAGFPAGYQAFENPSSQPGHERLSTWAHQYLHDNNAKAFENLRLEAGRADIADVSSVAPHAYHRVATVRAVENLEQALQSGDANAQRAALRDLARLRLIRLGSEQEYQSVHQAIDDYLGRPRENNMQRPWRDEVASAMRTAQQDLTRNFVSATDSLAAMISSNDPQERQRAFEAFRNNANQSGDERLLQWSSRTADYMAATQIRQALEGNPPSQPAVVQALQQLETANPEIQRSFLSQFTDSWRRANPNQNHDGDFTLAELRERLSQQGDAGRQEMQALLPHLHAGLSGEQFEKIDTEMAALRQSDLTAAEILRAGYRGHPVSHEQFRRALNEAEQESRETNRDFDRLERDFLNRSATPEQRNTALNALRDFMRDHVGISGDPARMSSYGELEAINALAQLRAAQTPADAARELANLRTLAQEGSLPAGQLLERMRGDGQANFADDLIRRLSSDNATDAQAALDALHRQMPNAEQELNALRTRNLTRDFQTNQIPTAEAVDTLRQQLQEEVRLGNSSAAPWLQWTEAARQMTVLGNPNSTEDQRRQAITELGRLSSNGTSLDGNPGNPYARTMLAGIALGGSTPDSYSMWNNRWNAADAPPMLIPGLANLSVTEAGSLRSQAVTALENFATQNPRSGVLTPAEHAALAITLGQTSDEGTRNSLLNVIRNGMNGPDGARTLDAVYDQLRTNVPGGDQIARALLTGANRPEFAQYFNENSAWAARGDQAGIQVMAGILAGARTNPDLVAPARETLMRYASHPENAELVVNSLLEAYSQHGDQQALLRVMGEIAGRHQSLPEGQISAVRDLLRSQVEQLSASPRSSAVDQQRYSSAMAGLSNFARHWQMEDVGLLTQRITPEFAAAMREQSANIPENLRRATVDGVKNRLLDANSNESERLVALQAAGNLSAHLNANDVRAIANSVRSLPNGGSEQLQIALARTMMRVIADGANPETRNAAVGIFGETGWHPSLTNEVRQALIAYAQGRVTDARLLDQVTQLVGDAGVKPPLGVLVARMGVPLTDNLLRQLERAEQNYPGGRDAVRTILERAGSFSTLPPVIQEAIRSGNINGFNLENASQLQALPQPVDIQRLISLLSESNTSQNRLAQDGNLGFLANQTQGQRFEDRVDALRNRIAGAVAADSRGATTGDVLEAVSRQNLSNSPWHQQLLGQPPATEANARRTSLNNLNRETRDGHQTSLWWLMGTPVAYGIRRWASGGTQDQFNERQADRFRQFRESEQALARGIERRMGQVAVIQALNLAGQSGDHFRQIGQGNIIDSDRTALTMLRQYGSAPMMMFAPAVFNNLAGNGGPNFSDRGAWGRFVSHDATRVSGLPVFPPGPDGFRSAMEFLARRDLLPPHQRSENPYQYHTQGDIHAAVLQEAFRALDSQQTVRDIHGLAGRLQGLLSTTDTLFREGMAGHLGPDYVKEVRQMGTQLNQMLDEMQRQAPQVRQLITELRDLRNSTNDAEIRRGLDTRIQALQGLLDNFTPGGQNANGNGAYNQIREMCRVLNSSDFDPHTFGRWMSEHGATIALSIVAAAAISSAFVTAGATGPLAMLACSALIATAGYGVRQGVQQARNTFGNAAYGSDIYEAVYGRYQRPGMLRFHQGRFETTPDLREAATSALGQIIAETALNYAALGFGHILGRGLHYASGDAQRALMRNLLTQSAENMNMVNAAMRNNPLTRSFGQQFLRELGAQVPMGLISGSIEVGLQEGFQSSNFAMHLLTAFSAVAIHRVGGHIMRPRILGNGRIEIPANQEQFLGELRQQVSRNQQQNPPITIEPVSGTNRVNVRVGSQQFELTFVNPEAAARNLTSQGVRQAPRQEGEPPLQGQQGPHPEGTGAPRPQETPGGNGGTAPRPETLPPRPEGTPAEAATGRPSERPATPEPPDIRRQILLEMERLLASDPATITDPTRRQLVEQYQALRQAQLESNWGQFGRTFNRLQHSLESIIGSESGGGLGRVRSELNRLRMAGENFNEVLPDVVRNLAAQHDAIGRLVRPGNGRDTVSIPDLVAQTRTHIQTLESNLRTNLNIPQGEQLNFNRNVRPALERIADPAQRQQLERDFQVWQSLRTQLTAFHDAQTNPSGKINLESLQQLHTQIGQVLELARKVQTGQASQETLMAQVNQLRQRLSIATDLNNARQAINSASRSFDTRRDQPLGRENTNQQYQGNARELANARDALFKNLLQSHIQNRNEFNVTRGTDGGPSRIQWRGIDLPSDRTPGNPLTEPMRVQVMGNDGISHVAEIPAGYIPRASRDGHGIVFEPPSNWQGRRLIYRASSPNDLTADHGVNYANGYFRVTEQVTLPNGQTATHTLRINGQQMTGPVENNLMPNGQALFGIDGRNWALVSNGDGTYQVKHITEIAGTTQTLSAELALERTRLNNLVRQWQNRTHFHITAGP